MALLGTIGKMLLAYGLTTGIHPLGHVDEGRKLGVDVEIDPKTFSEKWYTDDPRKAARIHGAGFRGQDSVAKHTDSSKFIGKDMRNANALYKIAYLLGSPKLFDAKTKGDFTLLGDSLKDKGATKTMKAAVLLSAIADLHKAKNPKRPWDLDFIQSSTGAPGLGISGRF